MIEVRLAAVEDIPAINAIARMYPRELDFVSREKMKDAIKRGDLWLAIRDNVIVGFLLGRTLKRKAKRGICMVSVYDIAVHRDYRRCGIGSALIESLPGAIRLKCTTDNPANAFYEALGFAHIGTENGRKRELNVWQRITDVKPNFRS